MSVLKLQADKSRSVALDGRTICIADDKLARQAAYKNGRCPTIIRVRSTAANESATGRRSSSGPSPRRKVMRFGGMKWSARFAVVAGVTSRR
jgi:hypothetical protein